MECFSFYVTIMINAVELFKNIFVIKEEVRNAFISTDYYQCLISEETVNRNLSKRYTDLINIANVTSLFDNFIELDENTLEFDCEEMRRSIKNNDWANCYYKILCSFDMDKYIKAMDKLYQDDSKDMPLDEINGWALIDDSCFQYGRKLYDDCGLETWSFIQLEGNEEVGYRVRATTNISLADYSKEAIDEVVRTAYPGGLVQVEREYPSSSQQIILELIFEEEQGDNCHDIQKVSDESEGYEIIKRWLSKDGVIGSSVDSFIKRHESALQGTKDKAYYLNAYTKAWDRFYNEAKSLGVTDPSGDARDAFEDSATAEEVAGYYIDTYENEAYKIWMENLIYAEQSDYEACKKYHEQNEKVTEILKTLYPEDAANLDLEYPTEWLIGISGSEIDDVRMEIVTGTTDQVKRYLLDAVFCDRAKINPEEWANGPECLKDIEVKADGNLYVAQTYKNGQSNYTAKHLATIKTGFLSNGKFLPCSLDALSIQLICS